MAATPKKKSTKARQGKRRNSSYRLILPNLVLCQSCGKTKLPHIICPACGSYGKSVH